MINKTARAVDFVFLIIDLFAKMRYFITCKKSPDASHVAELFFMKVVRLHSVPRSFTSVRDIIFLGYFWRFLLSNLGTEFQYCSAYHPHSDDQIEIDNRILGNMLRFLASDRPT